MIRSTLRCVLLLSLGAVAACATETVSPGEDAGSDDAAAPADNGDANPGDSASSDDAATCFVPEPTHCAREGCVLPDVTLPSCEPDRQAIRLYGGDFCTARATLVQIHAPWCVPSMQESAALETVVTEAFAGRVRVITVLASDVDYSPPTLQSCTRYRDAYGLTDHTTYDPEGRLSAFAFDQYPATLLLDDRGVIVQRWIGYTVTARDEMVRAVENLVSRP